MNAIDPSTLSAALVTVIVALTAATVTIITAVTQMKSELLEKASEANRKADTAASKVEEIHTLVNGHTQTSEKKIVALEKQVQELLVQLTAVQERRVSEAKARPAQE